MTFHEILETLPGFATLTEAELAHMVRSMALTIMRDDELGVSALDLMPDWRSRYFRLLRKAGWDEDAFAERVRACVKDVIVLQNRSSWKTIKGGK